MKIHILGNGGALNDGIPYNSFLIDNFFLCETPPDITLSLFRDKIILENIEYIYISHYHGDHFFGLPFLLLRLFINTETEEFDESKSRLNIIGPGKILEKTRELCLMAFGDKHPILPWLDRAINFMEINKKAAIDLKGNRKLLFFNMNHIIENLGFTLYDKDIPLFTYFSDTTWHDSLTKWIEENPKVILADMNGEEDDFVKVHMSENDVIENIIPLCPDDTKIYGTHLRFDKVSNHSKIEYVKQGQIIEI